jgi:hypothetical protein
VLKRGNCCTRRAIYSSLPQHFPWVVTHEPFYSLE